MTTSKGISFHDGFYIGSVIFLLVVLLLTQLMRKRIRSDIRGTITFMAIMFLVTGTIDAYIGTTDPDIVTDRVFGWLFHFLGAQLAQLLIAAIIAMLGTAAFRFKKKNKRAYGSVEIVFGFVSAVLVAQHISGTAQDLAKWSTLAGSAYVIARGLGNRDEAIRDQESASASERSVIL